MKQKTVWMVVGVLVALSMAGAVRGEVESGAALASVDAFALRQLNRYVDSGPRLPVSYEGYAPLEGVGYVYDAALTAKYLARRGMIQQARAIGDALLRVQQADPIGDGRVRSAYKVTQPSGQGGLGLSIYDPDSATGNNAWVADALSRLFCATGDSRYLDGAIRAAEWIDAHARRDDAMGGYAVGELGWSSTPENYRVLEHQAGVVVAGRSLFSLTGDVRWHDMAEHAGNLIDRLYNEGGSHFWTGTRGQEGLEINYWPIPADQVWVCMLDGRDAERNGHVLQWVWDSLLVQEELDGRSYLGMRFSSGASGRVHTEVSASVSAAMLVVGKEAEAEILLASLEDIRLTAPNHDEAGVGLVAAPNPEGADSGYGVTFPNSRHLAPTVWYGNSLLLAEGDPWGNPFRAVPEPAALVLLLASSPLLLFRRRGPGDERAAVHRRRAQALGAGRHLLGVACVGIWPEASG